MISKDELILKVGENCGVSRETSSYFFEIFINRLSNKLKPGDILHFQNYGFFHKRNCRIQLGKASDSDVTKSYLIQLVLFSEERKVKGDLNSVHFLKISNLKTLWLDDKDFQKSLAAGDFAPHNERNQLIKYFATNAEVIIAGLRKDYDNELVDELVIPLSFDLNFLIKTGQKNISKSEDRISKSTSDVKPVSIENNETLQDTDKGKIKDIRKESADSGLPWNYGKKFLEKEKIISPQNTDDTKQKTEVKKQRMSEDQESEILKKSFKPVSSRLSDKKEEAESTEDVDTLKYSIKNKKVKTAEIVDQESEFTEVKSKTVGHKEKFDFKKNKRGLSDKHFQSFGSSSTRKNYYPIIAILSLILISVFLLYIYVIKDENTETDKTSLAYNITPPATVTVVNRDYEFAVTYPYPKSEIQTQVSGVNRDGILSGNLEPDLTRSDKPGIKDDKTEKVPEVKSTQQPDPVAEKITKDKPVETVKPVVEKSNRVFLYRGFYVVYIGTFSSEEVADREADKYFDMGYNAFIEVVESGRNKRAYKLNVGDFM